MVPLLLQQALADPVCVRLRAVAFPASHRIASLYLCYFKSASSLIRLEIAICPRYVEFFPQWKV